MAKVSRGLLIFYSCIAALSSRAQSDSSVIWHSAATLETNWAIRASESLTFRNGSGQASRAGVFSIGSDDVTFRFDSGKTMRWAFLDIETFDLTNSRRLVLRSYENKSWHRPGERDYTFRLAEAVPPRIAAALAQGVGKPSRNGLSRLDVAAFVTVPARHATRFGGSNGTLRFTDRGIGYTASEAGDSRNWRWSDIRTLADPDPYHLRIDGYRETYDFLLKEPLSRKLFDKVWDYVYAKDLNVSAEGGRP
jgi:hypothetical protein